MVYQPSHNPPTHQQWAAQRARDDHIPVGASAASAVTLLAGIWLLLAPSVLDYPGGSAARGNDIVIGSAIAVLAVVRVVAPRNVPWFSVVNVLLGGWLIMAPFAFDHIADVGAAMVNDIVVGLVVVVMAATSAAATFAYRRAHRKAADEHGR
ncbi:SPW repeat domain-containing protein [Saccharothrix deserti]|uniref:SPW repeat domain-containing protein n=1 Tax=Saccharothrix deserti TaxID=2593674 RepID=UPI00131D469D|nr:SPW repeat protein [Saccharothrix deserti]